MITMKTDHLRFTRKHAKEILEMYFLDGKSRQQIAVHFGVVDRHVNDLIKLYDARIVFDWDTLINRLNSAIKMSGTATKYAKQQKLSMYTIYRVYDKADDIDMTLQIKLLRKFDVDYTVQLTDYERGSAGRKKEIKEPKPKKKVGRVSHFSNEDDLIDRGDPTEVATTTEIISIVRNSLQELLKEKMISSGTTIRIFDKVDTLIREATLFGIHAERLGKGTELERTIVRKIMKGV